MAEGLLVDGNLSRLDAKINRKTNLLQMEYTYKIIDFAPAQLGGYGILLESPWGQMFVFNINPKIIDNPTDNELYFTLTEDDIRHFEITNYYSDEEFAKMTKFVQQFYHDENFYEKSKQKFKEYKYYPK